MRRKIALALVSVLVLTIIVTWPLQTRPAAASPDPESWLMYGMASFQNSSTELMGTPTIGREAIGTPMEPSWNLTFSDPRQLDDGSWIVDLTVPAATYHSRPSYSLEFIGWVQNTVTMTVDGYGWIFLNATGDVDCYTSNDNTGTYWISPSPQADTKAANQGEFPSVGPDEVAGTGDDGFGDGTADPRGSSILFIRTLVTASVASAPDWEFHFLFEYGWTSIWTTGVAYDEVNEPTSATDGVSSRQEGHPWEFFAGLKGYAPVPHGHLKWNAYVTYAAAWSQHNVATAMGELDLLVAETNKLVRGDCVIADVDNNNVVDIFDVVTVAKAFGTKDKGLGPDGKAGTADDVEVADPNFTPLADVNDPRGLVDIFDIVTLAKDFGKNLTPEI